MQTPSSAKDERDESVGLREMNPEFENLIMQKLSQPQPTDFNSQLSALADQLQKRQYGQKLESLFMQTLNPDHNRENTQFEQVSSLKSIASKDNLAMMFGASIAGSVGGMVSRFIPINLGIAGAPALLGGFLLNKYVLKNGIGNSIARGVMIGGGAVAMSGFTSGINLGGILVGGSIMAPSSGSGDIAGVTY